VIKTEMPMIKTLHNTSHSLEDTLRVAERLGKSHGITRSADVTDFSPIRLPVWISLRPNAKCLSQSAGKGLCSKSSHISSVMEGIEVAISESLDTENAKFYSVEESQSIPGNFININEYPVQSCLHRNQKIGWLSGYAMQSGERWMIPAEMLSLDFTQNGDKKLRPRYFRTTSNGLASGMTRVEARISALLEVVERHSITLSHKLNGNWRKLELSRYCPPTLSAVLDTFEKKDAKVAVFDSTVINGLYAITAHIWSPSGVIPAATGYGCSLDLEVAILRAVLEGHLE
jgi:ribosomal protein S12 methylthiotransferase accessory factor